MYIGAGVTMLSLIGGLVSLAFTGSSIGSLRLGGRTQPLPVVVTVGVVLFATMMALWLWMARANSQGRHWAASLLDGTGGTCDPAPIRQLGRREGGFRRVDVAHRPGRRVAALAPDVQRVL